jgi:hypothetical protein
MNIPATMRALLQTSLQGPHGTFLDGPQPPYLAGFEAAGEVVAVGEGVTGTGLGTHVVGGCWTRPPPVSPAWSRSTIRRWSRCSASRTCWRFRIQSGNKPFIATI